MGEVNRILPQHAVSALCQDQRKGIWIGTYSDGVYHLKNLYMVHYRSISGIEDPDVKRIQTTEKGIYFSDTRNVLYELQYDHWISGQAKLFLQSESPINAIYKAQGKDYLLCNTVSQKEPFSSPISGLCIAPGKKQGEYWVGKIYSFAYFEGDKETFNSAEIGFQERVNCLHHDPNTQKLWLGTLSGLYTFDGDSVKLFPGTQDIRIDELLWSNGRLLLATQGKGIGIVKEDNLEFVGKSEGLPTSFVRDLLAFEDRLVVATNKGLVIWRDSVERILDLSDGLMSNEINGLARSGNNLFIGTRKGLTVLDLDYLDLQPDNLTIEAKINTGEQWKGQAGSLRLPPSENSITFRLLTRDFRIEDAILYRYRLEPDTSWNYSTQQEISYSALSSGSYTFVASAQNEAGEWSQEPVRIPFVVEQQFWRQWWFIALMLLALAAIVRLIIRRQVNKVRKENFLQNQLNSLKIKALSAQMNPHFIFNSLNSIQNFLIENDLKRSNKYLTKFARLMRLVLNNSDKTFSPFREVIHSLELYMELERIRFNEQFDFAIQIQPNVDADSLKIPAMLMQPFVENAILHGILPGQKQGQITVSISRAGEHVLNCTIEDNGVGRDFHAGRQSKKFKSQGLRITRERLEAFQAIFDDQFHYEIIDLKNESGEPRGTRVELLVPCR
ncbi:histidine kinase [bacterium SCSIO 12741]|nr:histidine kinase [bacterium SCSIO 12741]